MALEPRSAAARRGRCAGRRARRPHRRAGARALRAGAAGRRARPGAGAGRRAAGGWPWPPAAARCCVLDAAGRSWRALPTLRRGGAAPGLGAGRRAAGRPTAKTARCASGAAKPTAAWRWPRCWRCAARPPARWPGRPTASGWPAATSAAALHVWDLAAAPTRAAVLRDAGAAGAGRHRRARRRPAHRRRRRARPGCACGTCRRSACSSGWRTRWPAESRGLRFHPQLPQLALGTLGGGVSVFALDGGAAVGRARRLVRRRAPGMPAHGPAAHRRPGRRGAQPCARGAGRARRCPSRMPTPWSRWPWRRAAAGSAPAWSIRPIRAAWSRPRGGGESGTVATRHRRRRQALQRRFAGLRARRPGAGWRPASAATCWSSTAPRASCVQRLETGADQVNAAAFSPDGRFIAALDNVGRLQLWAAASCSAMPRCGCATSPGRAGSDALRRARPAAPRWPGCRTARRVAIATQSGTALVIAVPVEEAPAQPR